MAEDKQKLSTADQDYGTVGGEEGDGETGGEGPASPQTSQSCSSVVDTRYLRSIEGILKLITIIFAVVGIIVTSVALYFGPSGWYYFVGIGYILYVLITFILETFVPNFYMNRIADAVIVGMYALLWLLSAIVNTAFAATGGNILLGVASIFAYISSGMCIAQVVFAILTWRTNGGTGPSKPICGK
ncbi:uncharacterized protein LOC135340998 [Halichondria panicea]|uniref:uncharacterized protein LOC135340998 n=1 Tax=Halichondria panicea TaxID=6063 RepID=UPI00312B856F